MRLAVEHLELADDSREAGQTSSRPTFTPLQPPSYPLAVRSPYLSAWLPGSAAATLPQSSPQFWTGAALIWTVIARVNSKTFNLFGVPHTEGYVNSPVTVLGGHFTSTHTTFSLQADNVQFTLDFFSPVSPKNYLRQSLPFSYLTVKATVLDGSLPSIQIYSDIDETWTGQTEKTVVEFKTHENVQAYMLRPEVNNVFAEKADMAAWGRVFYGAQKREDTVLTASRGLVASIRGEFAQYGWLAAGQAEWKRGNRNGFTPLYSVAGFAQDLGQVSGEKEVRFAIGHVRGAVINYLGETQTHFYRAKYPMAMPALAHFFADYEEALDEARKLDEVIETAAIASAGKKYADILALSLRQTFGGMEITVPEKTLDNKDPLVWIKEHSSNGNINTVDIIYPAFPVFYVLNPELIRLLLEPLLRYLDSGRYKNPYAVHDIGASYPKAIGHDNNKDEPMPIESTGNILILVNAYSQASGNTTWYKKYQGLLQRLADYLVEKGLYPEKQLSTNDAIGWIACQTNLGIKAAVALAAWGQLTKQPYYTTKGQEYAIEIHTELGVRTVKSDPQTQRRYFTISYDDNDWFGPFNLYPDKLLSLSAFPKIAFTTADTTYERRPAGVPLMGTLKWAKTDWQMFCAAASTSPELRAAFIDDLHAFISNGLNTAPFSDRYWVDEMYMPKRGTRFLRGQVHAFRARPTVGAHFAILALAGPGVLGDWVGSEGGVLFENMGELDKDDPRAL